MLSHHQSRVSSREVFPSNSPALHKGIATSYLLPTSTPWKPEALTPITSKTWPLRESMLPTALAAPPKCSRQKP